MTRMTYVTIADWDVVGRISHEDGDVVWLHSPKTGAFREAAEVDPGEYVFMNENSFLIGLSRDAALARVPAEYRAA
jgi:hypothetical protein